MIDVNNTLEEYQKAEMKLYPLEAKYKYLDSVTKVVLHGCFPSEGTVKDKEIAAYTHKDYKEHLEKVGKARFDYLEANAQRECAYNKLLLEKSSLTG